MKTIDVLNLGIDRNFLRECERREIIKPKRVKSEWIVDKNYIPREYTQEDVETVWESYLLRKMGLEFPQIKKAISGDFIDLRKSLDYSINKFQAQIEELQAILQFAKCVKSFGVIPVLPEKAMGSKSFKDFLNDYMNQIALKDANIKRSLDFLNVYFDDSVENKNKILKEMADEMEQVNVNNKNYKLADEFFNTVNKLKPLIKESPEVESVQMVVGELYQISKNLLNKQDFCTLDFVNCIGMIFAQESDYCELVKRTLGEPAVEFVLDAVVEYVRINDPKLFDEL